MRLKLKNMGQTKSIKQGKDVVTQLKDQLVKLNLEFTQYKRESIKWSVEDFTETAKAVGYELTVEQAQWCLEDMIHHHDASIGINWDSIRYYAISYGTKIKKT